jgi:hydroxyacylglutathione hydrolase
MSTEEIEFSGFDARHLVAIDANPWRVGEMLIEPILTLGHTPGCICYLIGDDIFSGDVLFAERCGVCLKIRAVHTMFASSQNLKRRQASNPRLSKTFLRETAWAAHVTAAPRKYLYECF